MNEMWKREEFLIANGMSQLPNSSMTNDLSPYDYFDGGLDVDVDRDFSDATGSGRRARRRVKKSRKATGGSRQRRSNQPRGGVKGRIAERKQANQRQAQQQAKDIEKVQKSSEADAQLLAQLTQAPATLPQPQKTGMTKTTKTVLIVGGVAVAVVVGFMLYKKFKK
jgi:hypothetical protein